MEPLVPHISATYFSAENYGVVDDPRTKIIFDDARHYIFTTRDKFDIITSDPIHPWVKGSATLYTKEYFELVKSHLNPGGIVTQWVPLYESDSAVVKSEIATFFEVFPDGTIWSNDENGKGYDVVLLGQAGETKINLDAIQQRLEQPEYSAVAQSLNDVGFQVRVRFVRHLRRTGARPGPVAEGRRDQPRPQFAPAISGGIPRQTGIAAKASSTRWLSIANFPANFSPARTPARQF